MVFNITGSLSMKVFAAVAIASLTLGAGTAHAEAGWRFGIGPSYVSGIEDVTDLYEYNMELGGYYDEVDVDMLLPVGIAFAADYHWSSGVRLDLGLGPFFLIAGDADHFEMPISGTVGYSFLPDSGVSPYLRAGFVHHFVDGDYYASADPGLFAAAGVDFGRLNTVKFTFEVAMDQSEVEFDTVRCTNQFLSSCRDATTKLNTYDVIASLYVKF
jgi:hypothetical protein